MESSSKTHTMVNILEDTTELFASNKPYSRRIYEIQEHVLQLSRNYKTRDEHFKLYNNIIKNGLGEIIEEITPDVSMEEYLKIYKERFLVYEIFDYMKSREKVELVNILIYYPESKLCFVYKAKNHYHVMLFGFLFEKIIRNISKDELDHLYLEKKRTLKHEKLIKEAPYRVSNIMNPDGYVSFPEHLEKVFEEYVNTTNKPYPELNLKFFRNYLWCHYHTMKPIEEKYMVEILRELLMNVTKFQDEIINYIISFLEKEKKKQSK